jgi:hypothetical protein
MIKTRKLFLGITLLAMLLVISWSSVIHSQDLNSQDPKNYCASGALRDKHKQPFACDSIWNMPIGANAQYVPANIKPAGNTTGDEDYYIVTSENDPFVPWYNPDSWMKGRCSNLGKGRNGYLRVPQDLIVPDATQTDTPNNATAFLQPDGATLIQMSPLARCESGGAVFGYVPPSYSHYNENIYGPGITGGHAGSGLSSIGGTVRLGELISDQPIRHTLKIEVYANKYLYNQPPGYRWPAVRADIYAFNDYYNEGSMHYGGSNPALTMGSLLAIPSQITEDSLGLQTIPGRKLFFALQNYGGYIVDDTLWDAHAIAIEQGTNEEFASHYHYSFDSSSGAFHDDINKLFQALQIIDNNAPENIGGGGKTLQPLASAIGN